MKTERLNWGRRTLLMLAIIFGFSVASPATEGAVPEMAMLKSYITYNYPSQLTNPQKKKRKSLSQFGYGLSYFVFPFYNISEFIEPGKFGEHSYGEPSRSEKNGALYTCRGGFIDFSHVRAGIDWTVYLTFKIVNEQGGFNLPDEAGKLSLQFTNLDKLNLSDIASLAQKIAYERLTWHEVASWHYHWPNYIISEQQSTFTPEDLYSNLLGTVIGKNIALRILTQQESLSFSQIASEEIAKTIGELVPVAGKNESKMAYDIVDRHKQSLVPANERNQDVWWDSKVVFRDVRYVFKRNTNIGPTLSPWLVPQQDRVGCPCNVKPNIIDVPTTTHMGQNLHSYYTFSIEPDSILFFAKKSGKQLHQPIAPFTTKSFRSVINLVEQEMQQVLLSGFNKRNHADPIPTYDHVKYVMF